MPSCKITQSAGILVGCDRLQESLLVWFYTQFRRHHPDLPIAFANFGMSSDALQWCLERGAILTVLPEAESNLEQFGFIFEGDVWGEWKLDPSTTTSEKKAYFRKPQALLQSPFIRTLWLDLDCEVRGDLSPLLSMPLSSSGLGATPCESFCFVKNFSKGFICRVEKYNTGVVLTDRGSSLLNLWASLTCGRAAFCTDEGSLSFLADRNEMPITPISHQYNWPARVWGEHPKALIYHWLGDKGKAFLQKRMREISGTL